MPKPRDMRQENIDNHNNNPNSEAETGHISSGGRLDHVNQGSDYSKMSFGDKVRAAFKGVDPYTGKKKR